jgi:hypothetical protein
MMMAVTSEKFNMQPIPVAKTWPPQPKSYLM